jgi:hypothetical protein
MICIIFRVARIIEDRINCSSQKVNGLRSLYM